MHANRSRVALILLLSLLLAMFGLLAVGCGSTSGKLFPKSSEEEASEVEDQITEIVDRFFRAISTGDVDELADTFDPDDIEEFEEEYGEDFEDALLAFFFEGDETSEFSDLKYDVEVDDDEATVKVTKGKVTYMGEDGKEETDMITRKDDVFFELVKSGRKWYISISSFPDLGSGSYAVTTTASNGGTTPTPTHTTPAPVPQPPSPEYVACGTCGGAGWIYCSDCGGEGGYYAEYEATCPDCGGSGGFICWACNGLGEVEGGDGRYPCDVCYGTGYTYCETCGETGIIIDESWVDCGTCGGSGDVGCPTCGGSGYVRT